jgi:hypothetical protein
VHQRNNDPAKDDENGYGGSAGEMVKGDVAKAQAPENLTAVCLLRDHSGASLQRNINHGSPPGGLHSALPRD